MYIQSMHAYHIHCKQACITSSASLFICNCDLHAWLISAMHAGRVHRWVHMHTWQVLIYNCMSSNCRPHLILTICCDDIDHHVAMVKCAATWRQIDIYYRPYYRPYYDSKIAGRNQNVPATFQPSQQTHFMEVAGITNSTSISKTAGGSTFSAFIDDERHILLASQWVMYVWRFFSYQPQLLSIGCCPASCPDRLDGYI